eukprot:430379-Amphidinium_carterae.1
MAKTYGDIRHGQPACRCGNCTFVAKCFGLSGERKGGSSLRMTSSIMYAKLRAKATPPEWKAEPTNSIPRLTL